MNGTIRRDVMSRLLCPDDPEPVILQNPTSTSPIVFISDHAGLAIPRRLGTLGLNEAALNRHIGWDIGILGVTARLADLLGAAYIYQPYSRLVIDCNRKVGSAQSIMTRSDGTDVPGNCGLSDAERAARAFEIMRPYHDAIDRLLDQRRAESIPTMVFSMHSCTPRLASDTRLRPWHVGVVAHDDWRLGAPLIELLQSEPELCVGRNEPYKVDMEMDYTVPVHCEGRGLPYVEVEIRQDLIGEETGQREWADRLSRILPRVVDQAKSWRSAR
jgi:predicted N-formylglutamate amidohydrolase